jgi:hypothetical protein
VERRHHPSHDRATWFQILAGFAVAAVGACAAFEDEAGTWVVWLGVAGVVVGFAIVFVTPVNRTSCPSCGATLRRARDTTEFVCTGCNVVWVTRGHGFGPRG